MVIRDGWASAENFWGEKLKNIFVEHHFTGLKPTYGSVRNIEHGATGEHIITFSYYTGLFSPQNYWRISIETIDGKKYSTNELFYCSITDADNGRAIIGVNGESQTAYVAFPSSSGCSRKMVRI
ncbi:hypothetical protein [Providencia manganoxydans]|uniref:hypothetical protein n=1 Tax=Providencia manganoxydans TaxID=2923283 RepID=UPI0034E3E1D8